LFTSYQTAIGVQVTEKTAPIFTDEYHSKTTSAHRNAFIREYGGRVVTAEEFSRLLSEKMDH
jgi:hypothetical protein